MGKRILAVELKLAADEVEECEFDSKVSCLDYDLVLIRPDISEAIEDAEEYQGKPSLNESASFRLTESCAYWKGQIKDAVDAGKNVFIFLAPMQELFVDTGARTHSGTGRNQKTTRLVKLFHNYNFLPFDVEMTNTHGKAMKLYNHGAEAFAPYWDEFAGLSNYAVVLDGGVPGVWLTTSQGGKPVGAVIRDEHSGGSYILLPDIDFYGTRFVEMHADGESCWTPEAERFAVKLLSTIVNLDRALKSTGEVTPEPPWATESRFSLSKERDLQQQLLTAEARLEEAQREKSKVQDQLKSVGSIRRLLYEKGKPLEAAIVDGLQALGFSAAPYKDSDSEFDVVFECPEGRLLGEAEGKDSKAINVDKLRQLQMNIHEDLNREEVENPAKPVLFANGFRLTLPDDRPCQFTDKCINAAVTQNTALVPTSRLFLAVQYLADHTDEDYAARCRAAILHGVGLVEIPEPPPSDAVPNLQSGA